MEDARSQYTDTQRPHFSVISVFPSPGVLHIMDYIEVKGRGSARPARDVYPIVYVESQRVETLQLADNYI